MAAAHFAKGHREAQRPSSLSPSGWCSWASMEGRVWSVADGADVARTGGQESANLYGLPPASLELALPFQSGGSTDGERQRVARVVPKPAQWQESWAAERGV